MYNFELSDELGPDKIIHIYNPKTKLKAILVIDNVSMGPSIGGIRMVQDISVEECFKLARSMTFKNAAAGLIHGGGKSMIMGDSNLPLKEKEILIRSFAKAIKDIKDYIPGPDMGTNEICMAWIKDEINRSVGLPRDIGGIPLDEIGATAYGLSVAIDVSKDFAHINLNEATIVIQGFGSVGKHAAIFLKNMGSKIIAVSDSSVCVYNSKGLDVEQIINHKNKTGSLKNYQNAQILDREKIIEIKCDILIPAARPDVINTSNINKLNTKLIAPGANIPMSAEIEEKLFSQGIMVLPDFIVNAGGVICAAVEYAGGTKNIAINTIEEKIRSNIQEVLIQSNEKKLSPRKIALDLVNKKIKTAMSYKLNYK